MRHLLKVHAEVDAQKVGDQTQYYNINLRMLRIKGYSFKKVRRSQFLSEVHLRDVHSKIVGYALGNNLNLQFNKQGIQNIYQLISDGKIKVFGFKVSNNDMNSESDEVLLTDDS